MNNIGALNNPEYGVNITSKICDYGNIQLDPPDHQDQRKLLAKLATKVGLCVERKLFPVVVGGGRDLLQGVCDAKNSPDVFLCVTNTLDLEPLLADDLCH